MILKNGYLQLRRKFITFPIISIILFNSDILQESISLYTNTIGTLACLGCLCLSVYVCIILFHAKSYQWNYFLSLEDKADVHFRFRILQFRNDFFFKYSSQSMLSIHESQLPNSTVFAATKLAAYMIKWLDTSQLLVQLVILFFCVRFWHAALWCAILFVIFGFFCIYRSLSFRRVFSITWIHRMCEYFFFSNLKPIIRFCICFAKCRRKQNGKEFATKLWLICHVTNWNGSPSSKNNHEQEQ